MQIALDAGEAIDLVFDAPHGDCSVDLRGRNGEQKAPIGGLITFLRVLNVDGCEADIDVNVTGKPAQASWIGGNETLNDKALIFNYSTKGECNAAISKYAFDVYDSIAIEIKARRKKSFHGVLPVQLTLTVPSRSSNRLKHYCSNVITIDYDLVCDSYFNCPSGSEEQLCNIVGEDALLRGQVLTGIGICVVVIFTMAGLRYLVSRYRNRRCRMPMPSEGGTSRDRGPVRTSSDVRIAVTRPATNAQCSSRVAQAQLQPLLQPQPASRSTTAAPTALANQRVRLVSEDAPPTYEEAVLSFPTPQT